MAAFFASSAQAKPKPAHPHCRAAGAPLLCQVHYQRALTNYWRGRMGLGRRHYGYGAERHPNRRPYFVWLWTAHRKLAKRRYAEWTRQPWLRGSIHDALLCIHSYEGAWNDPDAPYWGGLQADLSFQMTYGAEYYRRWGTADHWPVSAQLHMGYRGVKARGYSPWPTTARMCGLL